MCSEKELLSVVETSEKIRKWHKYHASYDRSFKLKLVSLDTPLQQWELMTAHCVRAYKEGICTKEAFTDQDLHDLSSLDKSPSKVDESDDVSNI